MNIGIVSLGLIGGYILKALADAGMEITAVTRNKNTIEEAKQYTKNVSDNFETLKNCDVVFVASPINKTVEILDILEAIVKPDCIVLDCASVKEFVMQKQRPYKFIGSHPMAGTAESGRIHDLQSGQTSAVRYESIQYDRSEQSPEYGLFQL